MLTLEVVSDHTWKLERKKIMNLDTLKFKLLMIQKKSLYEKNFFYLL